MKAKTLMKKVLACGLVLVMLLSVMACAAKESVGNGGNAVTDTPKTETSDAGTTPTGGETEPSDNPWAGLDLSKHETINCYVVGSLGTDWERVTKMAIEKMEKKINTTVNFVTIPWSDFQAKYNTFLAGDEDVDIIYAASWTGFSDYIRSGAFQPFDMDFVKKWMPLSAKQQPASSWEEVTYDGKLYGIPNAASYIGSGGIVTTQDLLDKYNFKSEDIKSFSDLENYLLAIAKGKNDGLFAINPQNSYPMDSNLLGYHTFGMDGGNITWMLYNYDYNKLNTKEAFDPDKLEWFAETENYKSFVLSMAKWNKAGVFPANVMANSTMIDDNFKEGKSAINWGDPYGASALRTTMKERGKEVVYLDCFFDDQSVTMRGSYCGYAACFPISSKKMERAAVAMDCMKYDPEINRLLVGGIEGEHYILDKETNTRELGPKAEAYPWGAWFYLLGNNDEPQTKIDADLQAYYDHYLSTEVSRDNFPVVGFTYDGSKYQAELAVLSSLMNEYRFSFCFGIFQDDTEKKLNEFISKCKDAGIDKIIADYKQQVKAFLAEHTK
jgi:ABC-type glycerol-3-phosphate transport system substrate-binding protein